MNRARTAAAVVLTLWIMAHPRDGAGAFESYVVPPLAFPLIWFTVNVFTGREFNYE